MNLREIEMICELINYKSFSDAAYNLSYNPSVVTKNVYNVEQELGIKLFIRSNKSSELQLTPEGKVLINIMNRINTNYQYMMELTKQLKGTYENVIRIGSQPRFGNQQEQEIVATFLFENPNTEINPIKMFSKDLMRLLQSGKLDCMFVTIHGDLQVDEYFKEEMDNSGIDVVYVSDDKDMYFGISDNYFCNREEATFKEFKDFTFAFPFQTSTDDQDQKAISSFKSLARENGFELKTMFVGQYDNTIFRLATMMPIAISTTHIPAKYDGIKFVKVTDWHTYSKLYFICMENNRKEALLNFKKTVKRYVKQTEINNRVDPRC